MVAGGVLARMALRNVVLLKIERRGIRLHRLNLVAPTSAGSTVAAKVAQNPWPLTTRLGGP